MLTLCPATPCPCLPCLPFSPPRADKIIAGLSAAKDSKLTGPVVDLKLQLDVAKLQALGNALDKVDAAIRALPTPSAVRDGGTWGLDRFYEFMCQSHSHSAAEWTKLLYKKVYWG